MNFEMKQNNHALDLTKYLRVLKKAKSFITCVLKSVSHPLKVMKNAFCFILKALFVL